MRLPCPVGFGLLEFAAHVSQHDIGSVHRRAALGHQLVETADGSQRVGRHLHVLVVFGELTDSVSRRLKLASGMVMLLLCVSGAQRAHAWVTGAECGNRLVSGRLRDGRDGECQCQCVSPVR